MINVRNSFIPPGLYFQSTNFFEEKNAGHQPGSALGWTAFATGSSSTSCSFAVSTLTSTGKIRKDVLGAQLSEAGLAEAVRAEAGLAGSAAR